MSKLLDLLQRISDGTPAPLGFGAARSNSVPGMALVGRASRPDSGSRPDGVSDAGPSLDAVIVDGAAGPDYLKQLGDLMGDLPWGPGLVSLDDDDAQACQDCGADLVTFTLESSAAAATAGQDELARLVAVSADLSDRQLRAVAALPVDGFVLDMCSVSGPWTLQDVVNVGALTRRTDKHVLVQVSNPPTGKELEALRNMGASGLIVDLSALSSDELADLKSALQDMPRPRPRRRDRMRGPVPSSGFTPSSPPSREEDDGHDDDYDDDYE